MGWCAGEASCIAPSRGASHTAHARSARGLSSVHCAHAHAAGKVAEGESRATVPSIRVSCADGPPSGDWGSLPVEGGIEAAYKADLEKSDNPELLVKEIEEKMEKVRSPFRTAESFIAEEIIDPRDTRKYLSEFVNLTSKLRKSGKTKFGLRP